MSATTTRTTPTNPTPATTRTTTTPRDSEPDYDPDYTSILQRPLGSYTGALTLETVILAAGLLALTAGILAAPAIALLVLALPLAALLGVGTIAGLARYRSR